MRSKSKSNSKVTEIKPRKQVPWKGKKRGPYRSKENTRLVISKRSENNGKAEYLITEQDREMVAILSATGYQQERISWLLGISIDTLRKHFSEELDKALELKNAKVGLSLYQQAIKGNLGAICFWLKTRNPKAWPEQQPAIPPIESTARQLDYSKLSYQQQRQLRELFAVALGMEPPALAEAEVIDVTPVNGKSA